MSAYLKLEPVIHAEFKHLCSSYNSLRESVRYLIDDNEKLTRIMRTQEM